MARAKIKEILKADSTYLIIFLIVLAFITLYKLLLISQSGAKWFYDSYDYYHFGEEILKGNFISPEAKRTPGYPLFISLALIIFGKGINGVAYLQVVLGILSLYLFYKIQIDLGLKKKLVYFNIILFLIGPLSYFEINIFSETFTVFMTLLFLRITQLYVQYKNYELGILSVFFALALILTRPQFILPMIIIAVYLFIKQYRKYAYWLVGSVLVLCLIYSGVNYKFSGYFGMSSYLGYNIINHTGEYIEKGRDLNPELTDIYVRTREVFKKQNGGSQAFTIWVCNEQINKKLNYNFVKLSNELTRMSIHLILMDPLEYLKSYMAALYKSLLYNDEYNPGSNKITHFSFINLIIFVAGALLLLIIRSENIFLNILKLMFFVNLLFAGLIDIGENFRHIVTLQFILIFAFSSGVYLIFKKLRFEEVLTNTN